MKKSKVLSFCLAAVFAASMFSLPMGAAAEGEAAPAESQVGWTADFSEAGLAKWITVSKTGGLDTNLTADNAKLNAESYGETGVKLNFKEGSFPDPVKDEEAWKNAEHWAYSSQEVTVDLSKSPILVAEVADLADADDAFEINLDIQVEGATKRLQVGTLGRNGRYVFDLTKPLTVSGSNPAETISLSGEVTFNLNMVALDVDKDYSTLIMKELRITDKADPWVADVSDLSGWDGTVSGHKTYVNMSDPKAMINAVANGDLGGMKLSLKKDQMDASYDAEYYHFMRITMRLDLTATPDL